MNTRDSIQELTLSVFKAMNTRNFSEFEKNITEGVAFDFPGAGRIEGNKRVLIFLKALLRKYKRLVFNVSEVIVEDNRACAVWSNEGEHVEGMAYANRGVTLLYFSGDGKIQLISDYFKDTSFVK